MNIIIRDLELFGLIAIVLLVVAFWTHADTRNQEHKSGRLQRDARGDDHIA